ncbi:MAG TPA: hypothetical protein VHD36_04010 [Pirellulales bacterium]|nr:hypothetical protein [Pirellulales bacterium]
MKRFTLSQMFMGVAVLALLFALVPAEGCGEPYTRIQALSFSPDGKRLAVVKLNWRNANVPLKGYAANIARNICLVDVESATPTEIVERNFLPGNQGPAFAVLRQCPDSLAFSADGNSLFFLDANASEIRVCDLNAKEVTTFGPVTQAAHLHFSLSQDRSLVAQSSWGSGVSLLAADNAKQIENAPNIAIFSPFRSGIALSADNHWVAIRDQDKVKLYDATANLRAGPSYDCSGTGGFAFSPVAAQLAVASDNNILFCDPTTNAMRTFPCEMEIRNVQFVGADNLVIATEHGVTLVRVATGEVAARLKHDSWVTALATSPDARTVAIGDNRGHVLLWDAKTGRSSSFRAPGRSGYPWTLPAGILVVFAAFYFYTRKR